MTKDTDPLTSPLFSKTGNSILAWTAILSALCLGILAVLFYTFDARTTQKQKHLFNEQQTLQTDLGAKSLRREITGYTEKIPFLIQESIYQETTTTQDFLQIRNDFKKIAKAFPDILFAAFYVSPEKKQILLSKNNTESTLYEQTSWHEVEQQWPIFLLPSSPSHTCSFSIIQRRQVAHILIPLRKEHGLRGILSITADLQPSIHEYIAPIRSGKFGSAYLLTDEGTILFDHESSIIGRNVFDSLHAGYPELEAIDRRMLTEPKGTGSYAFVVERGGKTQRKLVAWNTITLDQAGHKLIVALSAPEQEINEPLAALWPQRFILVGVMLLLALIGGIIFINALATRRLILSKKQLSNIINFLPDATFVVDAHNRVLAWNKALEKMTGIPKEDVLGRNDFREMYFGHPRNMLTDYLDSSDLEIAKIYPSFRRENGCLSAEKFIPELYDGTGAHVWFTASRLYDARQNVIGSIESIRDITQFKATEQALRHSQERFTLAVEENYTGIWDWDKRTDNVYFSPRWKRIIGFEENEFPNTIHAWQERIHPADHVRVMEANHALTPAAPCFEIEYRIRAKNDTYRWIAGRGRGLWDENGVLCRLAGSHRDITERKQNEFILEALLRISTMSNRIRKTESLFKEIHGILKELMGAKNFFVAIWDKDRGAITFPYFVDEFDTGRCYDTIKTDISFDQKGLVPWVLRNERPLFLTRDDEILDQCKGHKPLVWLGVPIIIGNTTRGVLCVQDYHDANRFVEKDQDFLFAVAEQTALALDRKQNEDQMSFYAMHDPLTNLPNRALFVDRLEISIKRSQRNPAYNFAVMMIDLDQFKKINDCMGHVTGDKLLIQLSSRIKPLLRGVDTIARIGGDEFVVLAENFNNPREIIIIAKRILTALQEPFIIEGKTVHTNASIGIVINTVHYTQADNILRDADIAMYEAKNLGPGRFRVFNKNMRHQAVEIVQLENDLRQAIGEKQIQVVYQPIFSIDPLYVAGFEALARWHHPEKGPIGPDIFIHLAEETGLIHQLGHDILNTACETLAQWQQTYAPEPPLVMTVNLSAKQLAHPQLIEQVDHAMKKYGIPPHTLKLEITESTFMEHPRTSRIVLDRLKKLGVFLAVDDFGTGYSSLSYLQKLPVDTLKVDRSFIMDLQTNPKSRVIARAVLALAHSLDKDVIAEGVENEEQFSILRNLGCEKVQGYYLSKPLSKDAAQKFLDDQFQ